MYIFAPEAGCTGPTRLVRPGDEMIFNSSYNPSDWATESSVKTKFDDTAIPHTCPAGLSHKNFSADTMKQICWVRKMYREWRAHRHLCGLDYIVCDLEDKATITAESLKFALCHFITEINKVNGGRLSWQDLVSYSGLRSVSPKMHGLCLQSDQ